MLLPLASHRMLKAAVAGAAAVWVMDRFDWFAFNHENPRARRRTEAVRPEGMDPAHAFAAKAAQLAGTTLGPFSPHQHPAGLAVHYAVPMGLAILYGTLRRRIPAAGAGKGALYGASIFVLLDEVINRLLGLAARPHRYPWQRHARELAAHIIYGMTVDAVLRLLSDSSVSGRHVSNVSAEVQPRPLPQAMADRSTADSFSSH
jgi:hypothetical protein